MYGSGINASSYILEESRLEKNDPNHAPAFNQLNRAQANPKLYAFASSNPDLLKPVVNNEKSDVHSFITRKSYC